MTYISEPTQLTTGTTSAVAPTPSRAASKSNFKLPFIDGLRGLAALYVALAHTIGIATIGHHLSARAVLILSPLQWGPDAVAIFMALSGFCLMWPVVQTEGATLSGGLPGFFRKRCLRILPAYYAACLVTVAVALLGARHHGSHGGLDVLLQNARLSKGILLSHLFLVHDLRPDWIYTIALPLWSIPVEWHIYFIFALVLLPLYRRAGIGPAVALAIFVGSGVHFLLPAHYRVDWMHPYMLGIFGMGMAAAVICKAGDGDEGSLLRRVRWPSVFWGLVFVAYILVGWVLHKRTDYAVMQPLVGFCAMTLILACAQLRRYPDNPSRSIRGLLSLLESKWVVGLGAFSYSLYLIHWVVVSHVNGNVQRLHLPVPIYYAVSITLGLGLAVAGAYVLHITVERPFLRLKDRGAKSPRVELRPAGMEDVSS